MEDDRPELGTPNVPGEEDGPETHPDEGNEMPEVGYTPNVSMPEVRRRDVDPNA